jgi:hypothetical protein
MYDKTLAAINAIDLELIEALKANDVARAGMMRTAEDAKRVAMDNYRVDISAATEAQVAIEMSVLSGDTSGSEGPSPRGHGVIGKKAK